MAFFKFRKGGEDQPTPTSAPESVEALRKRAKHRLIGASLLVLLGVIGFPLLFDNQPRPIPVDLPIDIPDKNKVKPLGNLPVGSLNGSSGVVNEESMPPPSPKASAEAAAASTPLAPSTKSSTVAIPSPGGSRNASGSVTAPVAASAVAGPAASKVEKLTQKPVEKPLIVKAEVAKPEPSKEEAIKALALLEGKETVVPTPGAARYVVQVGAFSDVVKAREARVKLEAAGLKTYTQVVNPKDGKRIRVRVGPFESKSQADTAAARIKKLDLPAAILEL